MKTDMESTSTAPITSDRSPSTSDGSDLEQWQEFWLRLAGDYEVILFELDQAA